MKPLTHSIRAVGRVVPETQRVWRVVSRTAAYVQELGVNAPGELVKKNQVLMKLYSPELLTTQRELIDLLRSRDGTAKNTHSARGDFQHLNESAERRLRLWNVTDEQITKIEQTRQAEESLPILSKVDGVVQNLPVTQGANVTMGSPLVEVADLSVVWVWGEFYQDELPMLQIGQEVTVTSSSYPGEKFRGQITLIDPFIDKVKRTRRREREFFDRRRIKNSGGAQRFSAAINGVNRDRETDRGERAEQISRLHFRHLWRRGWHLRADPHAARRDS